MNQLELRYQAVQCHVRAQRVTNEDDAAWLLDLASALAKMADIHDAQIVSRYCRNLMQAS